MSPTLRETLAAAADLSPADSVEHRVAVALRLATHAPVLLEAVKVMVDYAEGDGTGLDVASMGRRLARERRA